MSARFVGEDEVFDIICDLDAIIELREEFDAANGMVVSRYALFKIFLLLSFYDAPSMFIDIGIFFYVCHDIFYSFGLSLHLLL